MCVQWYSYVLAKLNKAIKIYVAYVDAHTGKTDETSKHNGLADKLASCSHKSGILQLVREHTQYEPARTVDHIVGKLESLPEH